MRIPDLLTSAGMHLVRGQRKGRGSMQPASSALHRQPGLIMMGHLRGHESGCDRLFRRGQMLGRSCDQAGQHPLADLDSQ